MERKKTKYAVCMMAALLALTACQSKHEQLQQQIEQRKEALKHHQDSALTAAQRTVQQLDEQLQQAKADYERMKRAADAAHANGTATAEQLTATTQMRLHRDSLQAQFDAECAKIKYIRKRQKE
jgi:uncharacterized protein (DUF342 family)